MHACRGQVKYELRAAIHVRDKGKTRHLHSPAQPLRVHAAPPPGPPAPVERSQVCLQHALGLACESGELHRLRAPHLGLQPARQA